MKQLFRNFLFIFSVFVLIECNNKTNEYTGIDDLKKSGNSDDTSISNLINKNNNLFDTTEIQWKIEKNIVIKSGIDSGSIETNIELKTYYCNKQKINDFLNAFPEIQKIPTDSAPEFPKIIGDQFILFKHKKDTFLYLVIPPAAKDTKESILKINNIYCQTDFSELYKSLEIIKNNH